MATGIHGAAGYAPLLSVYRTFLRDLVGAVYDRAFVVEFYEKRAVIDRPYRRNRRISWISGRSICVRLTPIQAIFPSGLTTKVAGCAMLKPSTPTR